MKAFLVDVARSTAKALAVCAGILVAAIVLTCLVEGQTTGVIGPVTRAIFGSASGPIITSGSGSPESSVTAPVGSVYLRTGGGAGTSHYVKESGSGNTGWNAVSGAGGAVITQTLFVKAAVCDEAGGYSPDWHSFGSNFPTYACSGGTNVESGLLNFLDSEVEQIYFEWKLPANWTSTVDVNVLWRTSVTSGNVQWLLETGCYANGESFDVTFNSPQTLTSTAQGTANRRNSVSQTGLTMTGCAAGESFIFKFSRNPSAGGDTLTATASLIGVEFVYRTTM